MNTIELVVGKIIKAFLADSVQSKPTDIQTNFSLLNTNLTVLDSTPAGNGLSEALLKQDNVNKALKSCIQTLEYYNEAHMKPKFKNYILELCEEEVMHDPGEIASVIKPL